MRVPVPDLLERLDTVLAGRYALERELGRGRMAAVYLACDVRHDRRVEEACELFDSVAADASAAAVGKYCSVMSHALRGDRAGAARTVTPQLEAAAQAHELFSWWMADGYAVLGRAAEPPSRRHAPATP